MCTCAWVWWGSPGSRWFFSSCWSGNRATWGTRVGTQGVLGRLTKNYLTHMRTQDGSLRAGQFLSCIKDGDQVLLSLGQINQKRKIFCAWLEQSYEDTYGTGRKGAEDWATSLISHLSNPYTKYLRATWSPEKEIILISELAWGSRE